MLVENMESRMPPFISGKYNGGEVAELKKMNELEAENAKLKRLVANLTLDNLILKDII